MSNSKNVLITLTGIGFFATLVRFSTLNNYLFLDKILLCSFIIGGLCFLRLNVRRKKSAASPKEVIKNKLSTKSLNLKTWKK